MIISRGCHQTRSATVKLSFKFILVGLTFLGFLNPVCADVTEIYARVSDATLEKSPEILLAQSVLNQKQAARYVAGTNWAPRVDLTLSNTTSKDFSAVTSGFLGSFAQAFAPVETTLGSYQILAQMPLYDRSVHLGLIRANSDVSLAKADLALSKAKASWNLRQVFGGYLLQAYKLSTIDHSLQVARSNLQEAEQRFRLGSRTVIDVLKAQSQLAQLEAKKVNYESEKAQALSRLVDYTGLSVQELEAAGIESVTSAEVVGTAIDKFVSIDTLLDEVRKMPAGRDQIASQIESESTEFKRLRLQEEFEEQQAQQVVAGEWPQLVLRGSLGKQAPQWSRTLSVDETSYSYGLVLKLPLFSFGSLIASRREASAMSAASSIRRKRETENLLSTIQNLTLKSQSLSKSIESLRYSVQKDIEIEKLTQRSYQLGKSSFLDVQLAQNDLLDSKIAYAQAEVDFAVTVWQMKWHVGAFAQ
jgi:outer membrane protein TolC